jgi:hypothetical protein
MGNWREAKRPVAQRRRQGRACASPSWSACPSPCWAGLSRPSTSSRGNDRRRPSKERLARHQCRKTWMVATRATMTGEEPAPRASAAVRFAPRWSRGRHLSSAPLLTGEGFPAPLPSWSGLSRPSTSSRGNDRRRPSKERLTGHRRRKTWMVATRATMTGRNRRLARRQR